MRAGVKVVTPKYRKPMFLHYSILKDRHSVKNLLQHWKDVSLRYSIFERTDSKQKKAPEGDTRNPRTLKRSTFKKLSPATIVASSVYSSVSHANPLHVLNHAHSMYNIPFVIFAAAKETPIA